MAHHNENEDYNKQSTSPPAMRPQRSRSESFVPRPSTPRSSSQSSMMTVFSALQEYDTDKDGYIDWQEFCAMCNAKNINDDDRDKYWTEFGGDERRTSKISCRQIAQKQSPIYNTMQKHHSDDEHDITGNKLKRSKTAKSDFSASVTTLLSDQGPLQLFERYDMEQDGTLNISQFVQMVNALYPPSTNDDRKHSEQEEDDKVIKDTFARINSDKGSSLYYREDVYDLEVELRRLGDAKPNKKEFLQLCEDVFGNKNEAQTEFNAIGLHESTDLSNPIADVRKIMNQFAAKMNSRGKHQYRFAKMTVETLCSWIEKHAIPSIEKNTALQGENEQLQQEKSTIEKKLSHKDNEERLTVDYVEQLNKDKEKIEKDLQQSKYMNADLQRRYEALCQQYDEVHNQLNKTQNDLNIAQKASKKLKKYSHENKELITQCNSLQKQLDILSKTHSTALHRLEDQKLELEFVNHLNESPHALMTPTTHYRTGATAPDSDEDEFDPNDSDEALYLRTNPRRYSDDSGPNIHSIITVGGHARVPSTMGLSDRDEPLILDTSHASYPALEPDAHVDDRMTDTQLQECITHQIQQSFREQTQQITQEWKQFELQLMQRIHQENKKRVDECRNAVPPPNHDAISPLSREHTTLRDLCDQTKKTMQTVSEIKDNWKQTELVITEQKDNLKDASNRIRHAVQQIQSDYEQDKDKEREHMEQIKTLKQDDAVVKHKKQLKEIENAIHGLKSQHNHHHSVCTKMLNDKLSDYNQNTKQIATHLQRVEEALCVKAIISTEAIESAQDKIQTTQLKAEMNNANKFSSLGSNIYSMKKQLNNVLDVLTTLKSDLPHVISDAVKASQLQIECKYVDTMDDNAAKDEDEEDEEDDDIPKLTQQIDDEAHQIEDALQSELISVIHKSKEELMEYMDLKLQHKTQIALLEKECKEEREYEKEQHCINNVKKVLSSQGTEMGATTHVLNAISDVKKEVERLANLHRTLIGLDIAQSMRFTNEENQTQIKQIQNGINSICAQLPNEKEANKFNDRLDASIKIYIQNVDQSHRKWLKEVFAQSHKTIRTERDHASAFWLEQVAKYQASMDRNLKGLSNEVIDLKKNVLNATQYNFGNDDESDTLEDDKDLKQFETRIVAKIQANQSSYWRDTGCGLLAAMAANLFFVILFFTHKGHYA